MSVNIKQLQALCKNTLGTTLGMEILEAEMGKVVVTMPVGPKVHQPFGILHGGASVALAESAASLGACLNLDLEKQRAVGIEINANHIKAKQDGSLKATAVPVHLGKSTQVWEIKIVDEKGTLICISRCTLAVISTQ